MGQRTSSEYTLIKVRVEDIEIDKETKEGERERNREG
jgi:hypothetical protein